MKENEKLAHKCTAPKSICVPTESGVTTKKQVEQKKQMLYNEQNKQTAKEK